MAQIDSEGNHTDWGFITGINNQVVTCPLRTGNWTGYTGTSKRIRFYVNVRAGHYIYSRNLLANFEGYTLLQKINYNETNTAAICQYKGIGANTAGTIDTELVSPNQLKIAIAKSESDSFAKMVRVPFGTLNWSYKAIDNTLTATFTEANRQSVTYTGGLFTICLLYTSDAADE